MVNIGYHAAQLQGRTNRSLYRTLLPWLVKRQLVQPRTIAADVYTMSCERDLPEQAASLYSFLRHVGIPNRFTIVSDGSYTADSLQMLRRIHPCVTVVQASTLLREDLPNCVKSYAAGSALGKKLVLEMSLPIDRPTIYTDSDVLFFSGSSALVALSESNDLQSWYLPDLPGALDTRLCQETEVLNPVNSGFMLLKKPLCWDIALERLARLQEPPSYFTEQTLLHLTLHDNGALPLCPGKFVVQREDQFIYSDIYAGRAISLRHYVGPVRHKFWTQFGNLI